MDLEQFAKDFLEEVLIDSQESSEFFVNVFTDKAVQYLVEAGECIDPTICHYISPDKKSRFNGYDIHEEDDALDLFIGYFDNIYSNRAMSERIVHQHFIFVERFFQQVMKGFGRELEESNDVFEAVQNIYSVKDSLKRVRIYFLTNRIVKPMSAAQKKINDIDISYHIWDIERVYQSFSSRAGKEKIHIDYQKEFSLGIPCVALPNENDIYDIYLAIMPGSVIAQIYAKWGQRLIERNIRSFLQAKGNVNKGIRDTLKNEPEMFMAYNNGLSTTAESVKTYINEMGELQIIEMVDWQIVNGGQTTASLYEALKKNVDLTNVYVQVKLTIIKDSMNVNKIVPLISKYANSQSKINASDFDANHEYHVELEKFSRKIWAPNLVMGKSTSKWFYERVRGQYLVEMGRCSNTTEKNKFKIQNPSNQKISKTDIAKYIMSWEQNPHIVSKGSEFNFNALMAKVKDNVDKYKVDEHYYKNVIALAILFKQCDKLVADLNFGGYKANIVTYSIALLSFISRQTIDLESIWINQEISQEIKESLKFIARTVFQHITNPPIAGTNVTQWCKREECWNLLILRIEGLPEINNIPLAKRKREIG